MTKAIPTASKLVIKWNQVVGEGYVGHACTLSCLLKPLLIAAHRRLEIGISDLVVAWNSGYFIDYFNYNIARLR